MPAALIPVPEARELPPDEAWRALFDDFGVLEDEPTEPMPLELQPQPESDFLAQVRRILGER